MAQSCFFRFHATEFVFPNECPSLCRHRPGHSLVKTNKVAQKRQAQTLKLGGVLSKENSLYLEMNIEKFNIPMQF